MEETALAEMKVTRGKLQRVEGDMLEASESEEDEEEDQEQMTLLQKLLRAQKAAPPMIKAKLHSNGRRYFTRGGAGGCTRCDNGGRVL